MLKSMTGVSVLTIAAIAATLPAQASARYHGHTTVAHGAYGGTLVDHRGVRRAPGAYDSRHSVQTSGGYGYVTDRSARWGEGSYSGGKQTTLNNGKSFGRSTSATANGDGSADYARTLTGPKGASRTVTGTVYRR